MRNLRPAAARLALIATAILAVAAQAAAGEFTVKALERPDYKAVFGRVESRDLVLARARLGGTILSLSVEEGSAVKAGDVVAVVVDDKLALQLGALDARHKALDAELNNANVDLARAQTLFETGVVAKKQVEGFQTRVDVLSNQRAAAEAERSVLVQQRSEGEVIAPAPGRVLGVPVTRGSVVMAGETIARIAGGGYFLRLSLPERHAGMISAGDDVLVGSRGMRDLGETSPLGHGKIVKVYPEIDGGRVLADVEVEGLGDFFVGERTRVWIPVAERRVIAVPAAALVTRSGVDYVRVALPTGTGDVAVIAGERFEDQGQPLVEILTGLAENDTVVLP